MSRKNDIFSNLEYFLAFDIVKGGSGPCKFVFNVQKVKEVLELHQFNRLPPVYFPFFGMYDLRGTPLPMIALEFLMGDGKWTREEALEASTRDWSGHKIIVIDIQGYFFGVCAGWVGRILDPKTVKYLPSPQSFSGKASFINGMIKQGDQIYYMIDIEYLLNELDGGILEKSVLKNPQPARFAGKRVLVAEDSRLFQKKALNMFEGLGFEVVIAENGEQALQIVRQRPRDFDLIFTDIEMPIRNGVSLIQEMRRSEELQSIPVIFNSSLSNEGLIRDIQNQNLGDYIIKYDEEAIVEVLNRLVSAGKLAA